MNYNLPLNPTSLGQVSYNVLSELQKLDPELSLIPIGNSDLSCFKNNEETGKFIIEAINRGGVSFKRGPALKLWHINGLRETVGSPPYAMTFHETDRLTKAETATLNSLEKVFVSSKYTKEVFEKTVTAPVVYCPLGFDADSFFEVEVPEDKTIVFGLRGKLEKRKHTLKIITAWIKRFGGDPRYRLDCSIYNPFYSNEEQTQLITSAFPNNEKPFNINILPYYKSNELYNKVLNAADIDLTGMSGCEGFNLPTFQSLCLGKQAVVLNAHVHKDFCNKENSFLVEPNGTIEADDGKFFMKGMEINQGEWFDWDEDAFIAACELALEKAKDYNVKGTDLINEFTYQRTAETLYKEMS